MVKYKIAISILFIFAVVGCKKPNPCKIIVQEDFRGDVIFIHSQPDGVVLEKDGPMVLTVPNNGILKMQTSIDAMPQAPVVYVEDKHGNQSEVPIYSFTGLSAQIEEGKVDTTKVALYGGSVTTVTTYENGLLCEISWTHFIFGTYREVLNTKGEQELDLKEVLMEKGMTARCLNNEEWPTEKTAD